MTVYVLHKCLVFMILYTLGFSENGDFSIFTTFKFILGFEAKTTRFYDRGQYITQPNQESEKPLPF